MKRSFLFMAFLGAFLILGTAGRIECMWEFRDPYPTRLIVLQLAIGVILMLPAIISSRRKT